MNERPNSPKTTEDNGAADAAAAARLQKLAARRAPGRAVPASAASRPPVRQRRIHPSKKARVGALGLSVAASAGLASFFATTAAAHTATAAGSAATSPGSTGATGATGTVATGVGTVATPVAATSSGTVDGAVESNKYGNVQVAVTFATNGSISTVTTLQSPAGGKSTNINSRAVPVLNTEAVTAQSSGVHVVSGATYTSDGYAKSLQSAIDTARASGLTTLT